ESFLAGLGLEAEVTDIDLYNIARAEQMLGKTNQFNVTTKRHKQSDLQQMLRMGGILLSLTLKDRFGDQGIVGLAIALNGSDSNALKVDSFLLSCRAIGRGAERVLWAKLVQRASNMGYSLLKAEYI